MCRNVLDDLPRSRIEYLIDEWIHDQRDRAVVSRRLLDGIIFEKLAEEFDLSVTQVKTICYRSQKKIIEHI